MMAVDVNSLRHRQTPAVNVLNKDSVTKTL